MQKIKLPYNLDLESRPYQGEILRDERPNKILVLPRRHGKTTLAIAKLVMEAIIHPNSVYHYVFPFYRQAKEAVWIAPNMIAQLVPPQAISKKTEQPMILYFHNGSQIHIKGADSPDSLRSLECHGVVFDEPAQIKPAIFDEIYYPILAANGGWSWYVGTPKGKNAFYQKYITAKKDPKWQVVHLKGSDAGLFTAEQLEVIRSEMTQRAFQQEIECDFLDDGGTLFRSVRECVADTLEQPEISKQYIMGVDLAKYSDFTDITVLDRHTHHVVHRDSFNQIDWNLQKAKIESLARRYNNARIRIDSTGCLTADQQIMTANGMKPIGQIKNGETVLTDKNRYRAISQIRSKKAKAEIVKVLPQYQCVPFEVSSNHGVLTARGWIEAGKLCNSDWLKVPIALPTGTTWKEVIAPPAELYHPKQDKFTDTTFFTNPLFWRVVGFYLGNGWGRIDKHHKTISFAFDLKKTDCLSDIKAFADLLGRKVYVRERQGCFEANVSCGWLASWFKNLGASATKKDLPALFDGLPDFCLKEIIRGYWRADGDTNTTKGRYRLRFTSSSLSMLTNVQRWLRSWEVISSLTKSERNPARDLSTKPKYTLIVNGANARKLANLLNLSAPPAKKINPAKGYFKNGWFYAPIKSINRKDKTVSLYEFEVAQDHSCQSHGVVLHNVGDPVTEDLIRAGLSVEPYRFTATSKKQLIENLVIILEDKKIRIPDDPNLIDQLEAYEAQLNERTGSVSYNAPSGLHDDAVISLALACWNLGEKAHTGESKKFSFEVSYDKFGRPTV